MAKKWMKRALALLLTAAAALPAAPALAESYRAVAAEGALKVYAEPTLSGDAVQLDAYSIVTVSDAQGNVAKLDRGGSSGYARLSKLTPLKDTGRSAVTKRATRIFASATLDSKSVSVPKGQELNLLYADDSYAIVEKDGNLGYALSAHLDLENGAPVTTAAIGDFSAASAGVNPSKVQRETYKATVVAATLPVYKKASASSRQLGTLSAGDGVTVYAQNSKWAYIGRSGSFGFCKLSGLERGAGKEDGEEPEEQIKVKVTAKKAKIYKKASTSSKLLGTLKKGVEVTLLGTDADWAHIELNGRKGYCKLSALTSQSDDSGSEGEIIDGHDPLGTVTVIKAKASVYARMNTNSQASTLKMGETLSYYGYDATWMLVGRDGEFGFMLRSTLSNASYGTLQLEDSGAGVAKLEKALLNMGYFDDVPGSEYTSYTVSAVMRLQEAVDMSRTGKADEPTQRVLYSGNAPESPLLSATLSKGSKNENVKRLQNRLYSLGYLSRTSSVDGDYGNNTSSAVELFQKAAGLSASGTANSKTLRTLYKDGAPHLPADKSPADEESNPGGDSSPGNTTDIPAGLASTTKEYRPDMSNAKKLEHVIYVAQQQLGKPYVFGAAGPATFDCSGLMMYSFGKIGVQLQHSAKGEGYNEKHAKISSKSGLVRGDMVFFNTVSDGDMCDHVGIYLGKNYCLHAGSGAGRVIISTIASGYYSRVFSWGRRVLQT